MAAFLYYICFLWIDIFKDNIFFVTVSKNPNLEYIVKWLHHFLKEQGQDPLLLVLDDVWSGSESLLEKFDQFKMPNYKLLVTSRSEFRRFGSSYRLQSLDYDNAMKLFHHYASLGDKSSHIPEDLSRQVLFSCNALYICLFMPYKRRKINYVRFLHKASIQTSEHIHFTISG